VRVLAEDGPTDGVRHFIQLQLPDVPILRDIVLRLVRDDGRVVHDLRLDATGTAELRSARGTYQIGLVYQPDE
jgi:hypothetical protein